MLMEIGLNEYLPKPLTRDMVLNQLRPKLLGDVAPDPTDRGGHVISICGAQGGAGATSIAINLALQLAETTKAKVALLDLHLQGGETAVMLGVRPGPGLRIALENPMRADTLFIERAAIEINERVRLISADEDLDAKLDITEEGVRHVLGLLRQRFNYIVVDVPSAARASHPSGDHSFPPRAGAAGSGGDRAAQCACAPHRRDQHRRQESGVHFAQSRQSRRGPSHRDDRQGPWARAGHGDSGSRQGDDAGGQSRSSGAQARVEDCDVTCAPIVREIAGVGDERKGWFRRLLGR